MKVSVIKRGENATLVQFTKGEKLSRALVPNTALEGRMVDDAILGSAPEVGFPFDQLLSGLLDELDTEQAGDDFRRELNNLGIFDVKDFEKRSGEVKAILAQATGLMLHNLRVRIREIGSADEQQS